MAVRKDRRRSAALPNKKARSIERAFVFESINSSDLAKDFLDDLLEVVFAGLDDAEFALGVVS